MFLRDNTFLAVKTNMILSSKGIFRAAQSVLLDDNFFQHLRKFPVTALFTHFPPDMFNTLTIKPTDFLLLTSRG